MLGKIRRKSCQLVRKFWNCSSAEVRKSWISRRMFFLSSLFSISTNAAASVFCKNRRRYSRRRALQISIFAYPSSPEFGIQSYVRVLIYTPGKDVPFHNPLRSCRNASALRLKNCFAGGSAKNGRLQGGPTSECRTYAPGWALVARCTCIGAPPSHFFGRKVLALPFRRERRLWISKTAEAWVFTCKDRRRYSQEWTESKSMK